MSYEQYTYILKVYFTVLSYPSLSVSDSTHNVMVLVTLFHAVSFLTQLRIFYAETVILSLVFPHTVGPCLISVTYCIHHIYVLIFFESTTGYFTFCDLTVHQVTKVQDSPVPIKLVFSGHFLHHNLPVLSMVHP